MTKFIETTNGSFVLSSEITELRSTGQKECAIKTRSGDLHFTAWCAPILARELERGSGHTMHAQPGYFVIYAASPEKAGGDWQTFRSPVVGWIVIEDPFHVGSIFGSLPIVPSVEKRRSVPQELRLFCVPLDCDRECFHRSSLFLNEIDPILRDGGLSGACRIPASLPVEG
jgi:hypothetical protein